MEGFQIARRVDGAEQVRSASRGKRQGFGRDSTTAARKTQEDNSSHVAAG